MYTLLSLVAAGFGIAIAPASIALHHAENVSVRELSDEPARSEIAIAWNREVSSAPAQFFLDLVVKRSPRVSR